MRDSQYWPQDHSIVPGNACTHITNKVIVIADADSDNVGIFSTSFQRTSNLASYHDGPLIIITNNIMHP